MSAKLNFEEFITTLRAFHHIGITAPAGADGDSVGTQCSLKLAFTQLFPGKKISIINEEACPQRYSFLSEARAFECSSDYLKKEHSEWPDCMICVDGGASRIGDDTTKLWKAAKARGQVDHHKFSNAAEEAEYQFRLYDPEAAATTVIVHKLLKKLGVKLSKDIAQAIYVGLIFDTGQFKHSNTSPETLRIAADLMETGFDHTSTAEKAMLMKSEGAFKILKVLLQGAHFELNGRYVWSVLDYKSFMDAGGNADDREGLIDQLFLTHRCEIAAFYFEKEPNSWKMSFRSRNNHNVAKLAQSLTSSGGGHAQAAGCSLTGPRDKVLGDCHTALKKLLV